MPEKHENRKNLQLDWSNVLKVTPLKIHSLSRLAEKYGLDKDMSEEQKDIIDGLEPFSKQEYLYKLKYIELLIFCFVGAGGLRKPLVGVTAAGSCRRS